MRYKVGDRVVLQDDIEQLGRLRRGIVYRIVRISDNWPDRVHVNLPEHRGMSGGIPLYKLKKAGGLPTVKDLLGEEL
jgi:uncharacterized protein YwbE